MQIRRLFGLNFLSAGRRSMRAEVSNDGATVSLLLTIASKTRLKHGFQQGESVSFGKQGLHRDRVGSSLNAMPDQYTQK